MSYFLFFSVFKNLIFTSLSKQNNHSSNQRLYNNQTSLPHFSKTASSRGKCGNEVGVMNRKSVLLRLFCLDNEVEMRFVNPQNSLQFFSSYAFAL